MLHSPHWLKGSWVVGQSGNHMPVDVGELVAKEFIVNLPGLIDLCQGLGDEAHFLHQLNSFRGSQMEQFCCMPFEDDDGPAGEELIFKQIGLGEAEVRGRANWNAEKWFGVIGFAVLPQNIEPPEEGFPC